MMSLEINKEDIQNLLKTFSGDLARKAIRSALDKTGTWSKNYLSDLVSQNYNIKSSDVKKAMKVIRTTQTNLCTSLITRGSALSLIDYFKAIQDATGVTATISPTWIKRTPHAFINVPNSSKKFGIMKRKGHWAQGISAGKRVIMMRKGKERYPTTGKAGWGPQVPALLARSKVLKPAEAKMIDHLYRELEAQITKRAMGQTRVAEIE